MQGLSQDLRGQPCPLIVSKKVSASVPDPISFIVNNCQIRS